MLQAINVLVGPASTHFFLPRIRNGTKFGEKWKVPMITVGGCDKTAPARCAEAANPVRGFLPAGPEEQKPGAWNRILRRPVVPSEGGMAKKKRPRRGGDRWDRLNADDAKETSRSA